MRWVATMITPSSTTDDQEDDLELEDHSDHSPPPPPCPREQSSPLPPPPPAMSPLHSTRYVAARPLGFTSAFTFRTPQLRSNFLIPPPQPIPIPTSNVHGTLHEDWSLGSGSSRKTSTEYSISPPSTSATYNYTDASITSISVPPGMIVSSAGGNNSSGGSRLSDFSSMTLPLTSTSSGFVASANRAWKTPSRPVIKVAKCRFVLN